MKRVSILAGALLATAGCGEQGENDVPMPLDKVPPSVMKVAEEKLPGVRFDSAYKETKDGKDVLRTSGKDQGGQDPGRGSDGGRQGAGGRLIDHPLPRMNETVEATSRISTRTAKPFSGSRSISFRPVHEPTTSEPPRAMPWSRSPGVIAAYRP